MELFHGRPDDCSGRLARELRVYDYLDKLGIEYWRTDHFDMPAMTMEDCEEALSLNFDENKMAAAVVGKIDRPLPLQD